MVPCYSDTLLLALIKKRPPPHRQGSERLQLPKLRSVDDAAGVMASIIAAVAAGEITSAEAAELSKLVDTYLKANEARYNFFKLL